MAEAVPLRRLTFIVGPNSSGKTSLIHSILFLVQSELLSLVNIAPIWTGILTDLGSYEDAVYGHEKQRRIEFEVTLQGITDEPIAFYVMLSSSADPVGFLSRLVLTDKSSGFYISANRKRGRGRGYSIKTSLSNKEIMQWSPSISNFRAPSIGSALATALGKIRSAITRGSKAYRPIVRLRRVLTTYDLLTYLYNIHRVASGRLPPDRWYARGGEETRDDRKILDRVDPSTIAIDLYAQQPKTSVERLLNELEMGTSLKVSNLSAYHTSLRTKDFITGVDANLTDVGYGISQTIPVLKALTYRSRGPLFIEQPEIHLHPQAQGALAEKLCLASRERQVIIETHSERVINRARILIAREKLDHNQVQILYVDKTKAGSRVTPIGLDRSGNFTAPWPKGFFDERYEDSMTLLHLQAQQD